MEIEITDPNALPEGLRGLVTDGKLNLAALAPAADLEMFKGKALTAAQEAIERRKALEAYKGFGSPDEIKAALEGKGKKADADQEQIVAQLQKKAADREAELLGQIKSTWSRQTLNDLKVELAKAGIVPEALDTLAGSISGRIAFDDDGNVRILSNDGRTPMIGSGQNGGATLADLAKETVSGPLGKYLVQDAGKGGSGKPPGSNGGTPAKTVTRSQMDAMSQADRANHFKSGGKVVD